MIVVKLIGGLGNQLFQYAAGRALAVHHGTELYLDTSFLERDPAGAYTKRGYELGQFHIHARPVNAYVLSHFNLTANPIVNKLKSFMPGAFRSVVFNESQPAFDKRFFKLPANSYLTGYWQDQRYFAAIREQLLHELVLQKESAGYKTMLHEILSVNAVAIHVRRGDYVSLPAASRFHGTPGMDYYRNAVKELARKAAFHYFIFSDDIAWCREQFSFLPLKTFVSGPALNAQEELLLMSRCKHQVIANSSFSWWAAWLNANPSKCVIAPEHWFAGKRTKQLSIVPDEWQIVA